MDWTIYLQANGEILRVYSGVEADLQLQLADGEAAVCGSATWLTHRVVDGALVLLATPRVPPFEGAAWSPHEGEWFDPLQRAETVALARIQARYRIVEEMSALEARQARPLRELLLAWSAGRPAPAEAAARVEEIDEQMAALRAQLVALA